MQLKIGIYGGAFNPPHLGHIKSARSAIRQLELDRLIIIPTGTPPHKKLPLNTPSSENRLKMTQTAFAKVKGCEVSDIEMTRNGESYTIDTARAIKKANSKSELFLLVGTDMFLNLESWKDGAELLKIVTPAVFSRKPDDKEKIKEHAVALFEQCGVTTQIVTGGIVDISSSELRELLPCRDGLRYINDASYTYIIRNRLYGAKADIEWVRKRSVVMHDFKRLPHVSGTEETAAKLAVTWGADEGDAREAALLHDITKHLDVRQHHAIMRKYGIKHGITKSSELKLLHAQTGALLARALFGVSDDVYNAIRWHTTGRAGMSTLEKIIYLADFIEPTRTDIEGLEDIRKLAYTDLNVAVLSGIESVVLDMENNCLKVNTASYEAIEDLKKQSVHRNIFKF